jgi:hypothetical protein
MSALPVVVDKKKCAVVGCTYAPHLFELPVGLQQSVLGEASCKRGVILIIVEEIFYG